MTIWFRCPRPLQSPETRLFCFPHAGGGAGLFYQWPGRLSDSGIEVWAAQLPGRENRIREAPLDNITNLVAQLAAYFPEDSTTPFAFFGHSLGALLAFELARELRRAARPEPGLLIVAAAAAPHIPAGKPHLNTLSRPEILDNLQSRYGGIPAAITDYPELLDLLMPMLRADLRLYENYAYRPAAPLSCPVIVIGGLEDSSLTRPELSAWRQHTTGSYELHLLPGGHFFVQEEANQLLPLLAERIRE